MLLGFYGTSWIYFRERRSVCPNFIHVLPHIEFQNILEVLKGLTVCGKFSQNQLTCDICAFKSFTDSYFKVWFAYVRFRSLLQCSVYLLHFFLVRLRNRVYRFTPRHSASWCNTLSRDWSHRTDSMHNPSPIAIMQSLQHWTEPLLSRWMSLPMGWCSDYTAITLTIREFVASLNFASPSKSAATATTATATRQRSRSLDFIIEGTHIFVARLNWSSSRTLSRAVNDVFPSEERCAYRGASRAPPKATHVPLIPKFPPSMWRDLGIGILASMRDTTVSAMSKTPPNIKRMEKMLKKNIKHMVHGRDLTIMWNVYPFYRDNDDDDSALHC